VLESLGLSVAHRRPSFIARHPERFTDGISAWLAARAVDQAGQDSRSRIMAMP
jgi:hypothetical protein